MLAINTRGHVSAESPTLEAKRAPWMEQVLSTPGRLNELVSTYGAPLHLHSLEEFDRNGQLLSAPLLEAGVQHQLYFARKANKAPWYAKRALESAWGVDTASKEELLETLSFGFGGRALLSTAIGKDDELMQIALREGVTLVLDTFDELYRLAKLATTTTKIAIRFSGFSLDEKKIYSRFGFDLTEITTVLEFLSKHRLLEVSLLHAHLDGYDYRTRAVAAENLLDFVALFRSYSHPVSGIDLGGGIPIRYVTNKPGWEEFSAALSGLGSLYPAWNEHPKGAFIQKILEQTLPDGELLSQALKRLKLSVSFEPGRAFLDSCGMTVSTVQFTKRDSAGDSLIGVALNRFQLRPFRAEIPFDPLFIRTSERSPEEESAAESFFIVGNLCSESDFIFRRKLNCAWRPTRGDLLVIPNSAGYLMHHQEIGTHGGGLAKNLLLDSESVLPLAVC